MSKKISSLKGIVAVALVFVLVLAAGGAGYASWLGATAEERAAAKAAAEYLASCKTIPAEELVEGVNDAMIDPNGVMTITATAPGVFGDDVCLKMMLEADGAVSKIEVVSQNETPDIGGKILSESSLSTYYGTTYGTGLDAFSGATMTSKAIFACIDAAEAQFEKVTGITPAPYVPSEEPEVEAPAAATKTSDDGSITVTTSAKGIMGDVVLDITVADGAVSAIEVVSHNETPGLGGAVLDPEFLAKYIGATSSEGLDGMAGATMTSNAVFECIDQALAAASSAPAASVSGTVVETSAKGIMGDVVLNITVDNGAVAAIDVVSHNETPGLGGAVLDPAFLAKYIGATSSEGLDGMAGATMTSNAVFECIDQALAAAGTAPAEEAPAEEVAEEPAAEETPVVEEVAEEVPAVETKVGVVSLRLASEAELVEGVSQAMVSGKGEVIANVSAKGVFGDDVCLKIYMDANGAVSKIVVVSHNETPGIGAAILEGDFIKGLTGVTSGEGLDAQAGATMTSNAIFACINAAAAQFAALH